MVSHSTSSCRLLGEERKRKLYMTFFLSFSFLPPVKCLFLCCICSWTHAQTKNPLPHHTAFYTNQVWTDMLFYRGLIMVQWKLAKTNMRITNLIDITNTLFGSPHINAICNAYNELFVITYELSGSLQHSLYRVFFVVWKLCDKTRAPSLTSQGTLLKRSPTKGMRDRGGQQFPSRQELYKPKNWILCMTFSLWNNAVFLAKSTRRL